MGRLSKAAKNAVTKEVSIDYATFDAVEQDRCQDLSSISDPSSKARLIGSGRCNNNNNNNGLVEIRPINKLDYKIDSNDK